MRKMLILLFACSSNDLQLPQDLAGGADLSGADLAAARDLASPTSTSVSCGAMDCVAPTPVCCRTSPFGDGTCIASGGACSTATWTCDNPADCAAGLVCCDTAAGSTCQSEADCTDMNGRPMCLQVNDCKA